MTKIAGKQDEARKRKDEADRKREAELREQFTVRGLTRKEIKALRAQGVDIFSFDGPEALRAVDPVLDTVFPDNEALDELVFTDAVLVYRAVLSATFGSEEDAKNL